MGWNDIQAADNEPLFAGIVSPTYYFLHSYFYTPAEEADVIAYANYGVSFAAAIRRGNIFATQFHPEKSHDWGIALLRNFAMI